MGMVDGCGYDGQQKDAICDVVDLAHTMGCQMCQKHVQMPYLYTGISFWYNIINMTQIYRGFQVGWPMILNPVPRMRITYNWKFKSSPTQGTCLPWQIQTVTSQSCQRLMQLISNGELCGWVLHTIVLPLRSPTSCYCLSALSDGIFHSFTKLTMLSLSLKGMVLRSCWEILVSSSCCTSSWVILASISARLRRN